jgi:DNA-binding CsgD family transcriptional regulator
VRVMYHYGYDKVSYGCATDCPSLGLKKRHGHISSFPADWLAHYAKNNLSEIDPVHVHALKVRSPAFWSKCEENVPDASVELMRNAADVGLRSGIIIPICDMGNEISIVSTASDAPASEETYETLAAVNLLSSYFYQGYKSFIKKPDAVELNAREYEILNWAAEGKTDSEIASIINLSTPTVRYHWNNIFKKLGVNSRVFAVSKAVQLQLITPRHIMKSA